MKNTKRILCAVLAVAMLLSVMLTGCDRPKLVINQVPTVAATYGDGQELSTGEYLAYLYLTFENTYNSAYEYYNQYAQYTGTYTDPLTQTYTYEDEENLSFYDYVVRITHDNIKAQIVLNQLMKDNGITWDAEDLSEFNKSMATLQKDAFIDLGFNNESYITASKNLNLCWNSAFYGLYGEGGKHADAVTADEVKEYFDTNYISYKMINIALTDSNNKALDKEGKAYKDLMNLMNGYMETYEKEGFLAAYEQYEKDSTTISDIKKAAATTTTTTTTGTGSTTAGTNGTNGTGTTAGTTAATTTTTASTTGTTTGTDTTTSTGTTTGTGAEEEEEEHDHDLRQDVDSSNSDYMDPALREAIQGKKGEDGEWEIQPIEIGECKIVEVTSGEVLYAVMVERLDPYKDDEGKDSTLFEDSKDDIVYSIKGDAFTEELEKAVAELKITFDKKVLEKCRPEKFTEEE